MRPLRAPTDKPIALRAIRPNAGVGAAYQKALQSLVTEMAGSVQYWIKAAWNAETPLTTLAQDASPVKNMRKTIDRLTKHWTRRFDKLSEDLATRFADKSIKHTNAAMQASLKDAGFTVEFNMTPRVREVAQGVIAENVGLIKSIPQKYLSEVEQQVWQSVAAGGDLATLSKALQDRYQVTARRAKLIARDQNAKAKAAIEAAQRSELGITKAQWVHSGAGKEPRPDHVKAGSEKLVYDINKGAYLGGVWTKPGVEINCRCTSRAIIDGWAD